MANHSFDDTLSNDVTIAQDPRATINPSRPGADTAGQRAVEALSGIATPHHGARIPLDIERTLGEGGMGIVHLATQRALGRKVAVKTLRPGIRSPSMTVKLLREAWVTGSLEHPNVVPVYDVAVDADGYPVIILKRIEGVQWAELMREPGEVRDRFGARDLLEWNLGILMQLCNAVHFAHSRGIVHRDLKPENVMIGEFGEVYLLDWGIAVSLRDDGSGRLPLASQAFETAGTPCYMAPEMLGSETPRLSERTDVYLLGAILFEIATGNAPHRGATVLDILRHAASSEVEVPPEVPLEVARICRRALDRDPDARFESAEQVRLAVQGFLQHRGSGQLADESERRLAELTNELNLRDTSDPSIRRAQLYNLYGECRFGFQQAIRSWAENDAARDGLRRASESMVEYELAQGDARAAALLLAEISEPRPELIARVRAAQSAHDEREVQVLALEKLGREHDASVGQTTRAFLLLLLGAVWTGSPLANEWLAIPDSHLRLALQPGLLCLVLIGLGFWARESMMKTAVNRALIGAAVLALFLQVIFHPGAALLGISPAAARVLNLALWAHVTGVLALAVDRRFALPTAGYALAFVGACIYPAQRHYFNAAGNLVMTAYMLFLWAPRKQHGATPEQGAPGA